MKEEGGDRGTKYSTNVSVRLYILIHQYIDAQSHLLHTPSLPLLLSVSIYTHTYTEQIRLSITALSWPVWKYWHCGGCDSPCSPWLTTARRWVTMAWTPTMRKPRPQPPSALCTRKTVGKVMMTSCRTRVCPCCNCMVIALSKKKKKNMKKSQVHSLSKSKSNSGRSSGFSWKFPSNYVLSE